MGCWNKTCGLSNLHIRAGEDVYVFVLEENTNKTDRCYSTAFWKPLLLPFMSKYNDYGGGEESSGPGFDLIMAGVADALVEMEQGENEYHDIPVKKEGFGEEQFFEAVHESRLFTKSWRDKNSMIDFVMMRKDIVDNILENYVIESYVGDGKGTCGWNNNYIQYKFKDILKDIPEFMDALVTRINPPGDDSGKLKDLRLSLMFMRGFDGVFDWKHPNKVGQWIRGDGYRYSSIVNVQDAVIELLETNNRSAAEELMVEHLKGQFINGFMEVTRHNWAPGGHEGSQSNDHDGYRTLCNAITSVLDAEQAEWDAENLDDEEVETTE